MQNIIAFAIELFPIAVMFSAVFFPAFILEMFQIMSECVSEAMDEVNQFSINSA